MYGRRAAKWRARPYLRRQAQHHFAAAPQYITTIPLRLVNAGGRIYFYTGSLSQHLAEEVLCPLLLGVVQEVRRGALRSDSFVSGSARRILLWMDVRSAVS